MLCWEMIKEILQRNYSRKWCPWYPSEAFLASSLPMLRLLMVFVSSGVCHDGINMFTCACRAGTHQPVCRDMDNACTKYPCANGGQCTDKINGFTCTCAPGALPKSRGLTKGGFLVGTCHPEISNKYDYSPGLGLQCIVYALVLWA